MSSELKKCHFCGSTLVSHEQVPGTFDTYSNGHVVCKGCSAIYKSYYRTLREKKLIDRYNYVNDAINNYDKLKDEVERLRGALELIMDGNESEIWESYPDVPYDQAVMMFAKQALEGN